MRRRAFLKASAASVAFPALACAGNGPSHKGHIQTVLGPITPDRLGKTLPHEHIMVDFIGADIVSPDRYVADEVYETILPYLKQIKAQGVTGFIDCTPMFLGRDVNVLKRLSETIGIHILTNTGQYKEPYLPQYAFEKSAEQLAEGWIKEAKEGIDGTDIKAGFIKIAIHKEELKPTQQKIVRAACLTHKSTGLNIACHSGYGPGVLHMLDIFEKEDTPPNALIMVHANSEKDLSYHKQIAKQGVWIEYDNIGSWKTERHIELISHMLNLGFEKQLLLSMDRGWYRVGEAGGGKIKPYTHLFGEFIPAMEKAGFGPKIINQLTVENPAKAFTIIG
jgi:predicted metal-dependent phosphotriesterase family hydrolase